MSLHKHQCGKCLHVFEHERPSTAGMSAEDGDRLYAEKHMCPACKEGPWYIIHHTPEEEAAAEERNFSQALVVLQLLSLLSPSVREKGSDL